MNSIIEWRNIVILLLTLQLALPILSTDIYLPSLAEITNHFHATVDQVQLTLTAYFFAFGIIQLLYGALSDLFGRKPMMLLSLFIYVLGSVCCTFSSNITLLIMSRVVQACGAGSAILSFAIIRDLYQGAQLSKVISYMSAVVAVSPVIAPIFGGYIQVNLSWRWNFIFLTLIGVGLLILSYLIIPETNRYKDKSESFKPLWLNYLNLFSNRYYMGHALSAAFAFGALFSYVSGAPYVLLNLMRYSPDIFGWLFSSAAIGYIAGAWFNGKLILRFGLKFMSTLGISSLIGGSIFMLIGTYLYPRQVVFILLPQIICEFGISIVISSAVANALQSIPHYVGSGSALIGFFRFLLASLCSYLMIAFSSHSSLPLSLTILICSLFSWACLKFSTYKNNLVILLG